MWVKCHQKHKLTPNGVLWERLATDNKDQLRGKYLEFVDRSLQREYIVALKFVRVEKDESPVLLGSHFSP